MTTNDIDAIRKLTDAATEGPWQRRDWTVRSFRGHIAECMNDEGDACRLDAAFIAAARTHVPALCDEIEQLRADLAETREHLAIDRQAVTTLREREQRAIAELEKVRAQLTAANHHADGLAADVRSHQQANTAHANENARLRSQLAELQPVIDAAKAWVRSTPVDFGRTGDALTDVVDALSEDVDRCDHDARLDVECQPCLVETYGQRETGVAR